MLLLKIAPETFRTVEEELLLFAGAVTLGIPAGMLSDLFRFLRRIFRHHWAVVMLEDFLFLILLSFLLLVYVSAFAGGDFRFYYVLACLCGFVIYECTLGRLLFLVWDSFVRICRKLLTTFVKHSKKQHQSEKL